MAKRSTNWSSAEEDALADAITKYGDIIRGKFNPQLTNVKKKDAWEKIADNVNAVGGNGRDLDQIKKKYYNLTSTTKKIASRNQKVIKKTGGGESEVVILSGTQEKMLSTIPKVLINGIEGGFDIADDYEQVSDVQENSMIITPTLASICDTSCEINDLSARNSLDTTAHDSSVSCSALLPSPSQLGANSTDNERLQRQTHKFKRRHTTEKLSPTEQLLKRQVELVAEQLEEMKKRNKIEDKRNKMIEHLVFHFTGRNCDE